MATLGDDKVMCSTNVNNEPDRNFINVYKKFECILNNKNESFTKKAGSVVEVWQNLALCKFENSDIQYIVQIIDWAKLHTLNIVLTGEWKKFKGQYEDPLLREVKSTQNQLTKINNAFYMRCQKLLDVINNPWSDPTLEYLVRTSNAEIGPKEIEFFCVETAYLTSVRLKKLCESQCEDLALNLVKAFMKCYRLSQSENFNLNATETQVWFIFDIYVALLYKFKENDSLLDMLKGLSAEEGLNLIKRFSKKRVKISKVWKHCHRIAILASQVYISSTILKPIEEIRSILKELLSAYVTLNSSDDFLQDVVESVRSIIRLAETAAHIYVFCEVFQEQFESKMKAFTIELYIRALTTDMNLLERQKTDNDKEKIAETTKNLAVGFTNLAEVLKSDINVSRECIMTAFSLQPTPERMKKIEELAKLSGFEVLDTGQVWKCKLHPPVLPSDDVTWVCNECGEYMCKPQLNVPLNTNTALNEALTEEKLGITRELCDDLVVLLSSPRYQVFSWLLNWPDLHRLCLIYLNDPERTKNLVTELKFLDIDYSIFATVKKEPLDEYAGIERGYEHYLDTEFDEDQMSNVSEDTGSQDSRFYSMSSDSAGELHCLPFGPRKSDPNTLKSLRMFRPNLKRSRTTAENHVPEKVMRNESFDSAIASSSKLTSFNSEPALSCQFPVNSILGLNSFGQESTSLSSSSLKSIIDTSPMRQEWPSSPLFNGISVEKPFTPIKLHPPQQNKAALETSDFIKGIKGHIPQQNNAGPEPSDFIKGIKVHPPQQNNARPEPSDFIKGMKVHPPQQNNAGPEPIDFIKSIKVHPPQQNNAGPEPSDFIKGIRVHPPQQNNAGLEPIDFIKSIKVHPPQQNNAGPEPSDFIEGIRVHPPQQNNAGLEPIDFIKSIKVHPPQHNNAGSEPIDFIKSIKVHPPQQNNAGLEPSDFSKGIKVHPSQWNIAGPEPLDFVKGKEIIQEKPTESHFPIKLHSLLNSTYREKPKYKDLEKSPVRSTCSTQNFKPIKLDSEYESTKEQSITATKQVNKNTTPFKLNPPHFVFNRKEPIRQKIQKGNNLIKLNENLGPHTKTYSNLSNHLHRTSTSQHKPENLSSTSTVTNDNSSATKELSNNLSASSVNDTNSKNGQVATLQQVGGQVAIDNGPTNTVSPNVIIGNPNNCKLTETAPNSISCSSSNHSSVSSSSCIPKIDPVITKEDATAITQPDCKDLEKTEEGEQNICPNTSASDEPTDFIDISDDSVEFILDKRDKFTAGNEPETIVVCDSPITVEIKDLPDFSKDSEEKLEEEPLSNEPPSNEVPNLFHDLDFREPEVETPSQYMQVKIIEVEETKRDTTNVKRYSKKIKLLEKPKKIEEELKINFLLYNKGDESIISIDETNDSYADTLINSDSEYDCFSSTNPILHNVLNKIDSYERKKLLSMNKENRFVQEDLKGPDNSRCEFSKNNNNLLLSTKELKYKEMKYKKNRWRKEPKYESYPDTGSDSQVELDSDDPYNRCYIELSRNNLLYDKIKGAFRNGDDYLNQFNNNNNLNDLPLKRGKKSKKASSSKKNRKSKTANALDKTGLDLDSKIKPKKDVSIRDVRIILERLPADVCRKYLNRQGRSNSSDHNKYQNKETCNKNQESNDKIPIDSNVTKTKLVEVNGKPFELKSPKVILERLSVINNNYVRSVLSKVPGLHDTEMMRPANTDMVVNVVQMAGGRSNTSVPVVNAQTSTQITPHIQRIGQPRVEKPQGEQTDNSETMVTSTVTSVSSTVKPSTSQPSTLINILSQQVIRPGQSSNCVKTRPTPLINIVSHQIIRPSNQPVAKMITSSAQTNEQVTSSPRPEPSSEQSSVANATTVKNVQATVKGATVPTSTPAPGAILQFICKSATLPKFQQAFGKTVYQPNNTESSDSTSTGENSNSTEISKKTAPPKNPTVNIQPIQGSVIYTRQVPVGQTINLIPPGRQVFRIATSNSDQISLVKDTVIHSKMSALLTAALQSKKTTEVQADSEGNNENVERVTVARPALVQNARIVKPVIQIPTNVIRTSTNTQASLSSTTLEQLREFDMVYKQIKERSNTGTTPIESSTQSEPENTSQGISVTYLNQGQKFTQLSPVVVVSSYCNLQPAASPALSVTSQGSSSPCVTPAPTPTLPKVSSKSSSKGKSLKNTATHTSKASPIPKPQQKPQEDEHTTQRIFDILAEYAEQLRNSPDLNNKPAPRRRSNPPTNPNHNSKRKKSSGSKKPSTSGSAISESDLDDQRTIGSEDSSCGVVQLSVKDDEPQNQTTESNDSTTGTRTMLSTETNTNATPRNLIIADSSVGEALKLQNTAVLVPGNYIMPVSMVKGAQQIAVVSGGSKILATVPARSGPNMLLFQSFLNQNRKPGMPTVKYSTLQPLSGISSQNIAGVSGQSQVILPQNAHNLTAVTLGQPLTLKKMDDSDNRVNTELLLAIAQPRNDSVNITECSQGDGSINVQATTNSIKLDDSGVQTNSTHGKVYTYQKTTIPAPIATPVISQTSHLKNESDENNATTQPSIITLNISPDKTKDDASKTVKRVQSVLVTTCTSNGPMLSQTPPRYRKTSDTTPVNNEINLKGGYLHNGEKQKDEVKSFQTTPVYFPNKIKKVTTNIRSDKELHQLCLQRKQAAIDRELRLQKSLSEECEDLGVDEPSTSDLFPEADLLFDSNHSPSFDQAAPEIGKKTLHQDMKDKTITLFSDDDNSSSLRTDFLFDSVQYQTECELQYEQSRQITNGQSSTSNESGSSCEDTTLLQNCASMSDVTLNSPISPEFNDNPAHMNKYKFKYSNRKKTERHKQVETWTTGGEVSSSEDTMCSELGKMARSPKSFVIKSSSCDEDEEFKFVRVSISKTDLAREEESCEELHYEDDLDSPSGRGARRSVKKMCSCCNGSQEGNRKRPSSQSHTPVLHKKAFLNKKR